MSYDYSAAVEASLQRAADRGVDPAAAIYGRLFEANPEMKALFWRDDDGAIRGEMLSRLFEAVLDFIGERRYASHMIGTEMVTHEGYDVPREVFATFFQVAGEGLREALGEDWTAEMEEGWRAMLADMSAFMEATPRPAPGH